MHTLAIVIHIHVTDLGGDVVWGPAESVGQNAVLNALLAHAKVRHLLIDWN